VLAVAGTLTSATEGHTMTIKASGAAFTLLILMWFFLLILVFVIVTIPAEGRLTSLLPEAFWKVREVIYPLFFSPSLF
jgi:hypothetical protein